MLIGPKLALVNNFQNWLSFQILLLVKFIKITKFNQNLTECLNMMKIAKKNIKKAQKSSK